MCTTKLIIISHCLKKDAGPQLEDADTATLSILWLGIPFVRLHSVSFGRTGKDLHIYT